MGENAGYLSIGFGYAVATHLVRFCLDWQRVDRPLRCRLAKDVVDYRGWQDVSCCCCQNTDIAPLAYPCLGTR